MNDLIMCLIIFAAYLTGVIAGKALERKRANEEAEHYRRQLETLRIQRDILERENAKEWRKRMKV